MCLTLSPSSFSLLFLVHRRKGRFGSRDTIASDAEVASSITRTNSKRMLSPSLPWYDINDNNHVTLTFSTERSFQCVEESLIYCLGLLACFRFFFIWLVGQTKMTTDASSNPSIMLLVYTSFFLFPFQHIEKMCLGDLKNDIKIHLCRLH